MFSRELLIPTEQMQLQMVYRLLSDDNNLTVEKAAEITAQFFKISFDEVNRSAQTLFWGYSQVRKFSLSIYHN